MSICNQLISQLFIKLRESGYSDASITTAVMEELYCGVLEPNDVEPVIERIRNDRNEALGGTWTDECLASQDFAEPQTAVEDKPISSIYLARQIKAALTQPQEQ